MRAFEREPKESWMSVGDEALTPKEAGELHVAAVVGEEALAEEVDRLGVVFDDEEDTLVGARAMRPLLLKAGRLVSKYGTGPRFEAVLERELERRRRRDAHEPFSVYRSHPETIPERSSDLR